ncbi:heparin lyase I family protein [Nocardia sp. NPDC051570]|uniref:heparin lyase I family protein n=1 Tax=Nocardia sp. NPDC051570 TaxID=3364324 RepID=UPI0037B6C287
MTTVLAVLMSIGLCATAHASVIWTGDPGQGTGVFGNLNCNSPGSITVAQDPDHGAVWQYHKPAGDNRCESHGVAVDGGKYKFRNDSTYYLGWWSKLSSLADDNANFQWKSYGDGISQNYPFVIKLIDGRVRVLQRQPDDHGKIVWTSAPITADTWYHYVVGVHTSDDLTGGWIQLWFNGQPATFTDGSTQYRCRTWDVSNDPKWGVYGAEDTDFTDTVAGLTLGTTYDDVAN